MSKKYPVAERKPPSPLYEPASPGYLTAVGRTGGTARSPLRQYVAVLIIRSTSIARRIVADESRMPNKKAI